MKRMFISLSRFLTRRKSPDVWFWSGRFITQVWTNSKGYSHPIDRVSFRRPLDGRTINEFWVDEMDDLALAAGQADEWIGCGIEPVDRKHLPQGRRRPHVSLAVRGRWYEAAATFGNVEAIIRRVRSRTGRTGYKAAFFALYEDGRRGVTFPETHLSSLEVAAEMVRQLIYGGQPVEGPAMPTEPTAPLTNGTAHA